MSGRTRVILLPGAVLPAELAYEALLGSFGDDVDAVAKDLEVYSEDEPPTGYGLDAEVEGVLRLADAKGFERFHLVGYSAGGAASLLFASQHPKWVQSLALLEPAWAGNRGRDSDEEAIWRELESIMSMPPEELIPAFIRAELRPGVESPPPSPGPQPPWMAKRPAGLRALMDAFAAEELDIEALRRFERPVYYALGALSNPDLYGKIAERLRGVFPDFTLEVFAHRHHFDPPHRIEPDRLARSLIDLWSRAEAA